MAEKWEMSAANTELKNRLQQSMAMSYMQGDNGNMLEEELHKMQVHRNRNLATLGFRSTAQCNVAKFLSLCAGGAGGGEEGHREALEEP